MKAAQKVKTPGWRAQGSLKKAQPKKNQRKKCSAKSTSTEAQRERILKALRVGPKTSYDLRRLGCYQSAARILELRRRGYDIRTERVTLYDRDGYAHRGAALYTLVSEPEA